MTHEFDYFRHHRIGLPECVYCEGKDLRVLERLLAELVRKKSHPVLLTKLSEKKHASLKPAISKKLDYDALSKTAYLHGTFPPLGPKAPVVAVVTAGSSDVAVAAEAVRTLRFLGIESRLFPDIGVAALWRLEKHLSAINACGVVIAAAGMDAAIVPVLGGLTARPLIAVPTSVGYGVAQGGVTALHSMLAGCSPGVTVVNIDNGYGAACAAFRILKEMRQ
ncbi:MAG: nickel pincer cofactor biosynthesis protein LarB [Candidatus Omnitrophota bacterium]|jgi:hypothetical protein